MAVFDYGLNLQLQNHATFLKQAGEIDKVFSGLANTVQAAADKLNNISFGNLKVDLSGISAIQTKTIDAKASAIQRIASAYRELGSEVNRIDSTRITEVNKALGGGARAETITTKAKALGLMTKRLTELAAIPDVSKVASQVTAMMQAFAAARIDPTTFQGFTQISKDIASLVNAFKKIGSLTIDKTILDNLTLLGLTLRNLAGPSMQNVIPLIGQLAAQLKVLFASIKTLAGGKQVADLPKVLGAVGSIISVLLRELSALNRPFAGGAKVIQQVNDLSVAFRNLGIAIRSYGSSGNAASFSTIESNISGTLKAFQTLIGAFKNTNFALDIQKSVKPATDALVSLGSAFETLGRRKGFTDFPNTIALINTSIQTLNVQALQELSNRIRVAVPALQQLAQVASAITTINTQAGRSFLQLATNKANDTSANRQLLASYIQLTASLFNILPAIRSLLPSFATLANVVKNLTVAFLALPFRVVATGFGGLKAIFVSFPLKTIEVGINAISSAFKLLGSVIVAPLNALKAIGLAARQFNAEFKLVQTGVSVVIAPFRLLYSILSAIVGVIQSVASAFGRVLTALSPFSRSAAESAKNLRETNTVAGQVERTLQGTSSAIKDSAQQLNNYNTQVQGTNRFTRIAVGGLQLFAGALVAKGVTTAVARLVNMQIAFRTLDALSRAAASGISFLQNAITGIVGEAFRAAAEFQRLQISISVLLGREQVQLNPGMFTDTLQAAKQMEGQANQLLESFQLLAVASPFTTTEIAEGFRMAQVYGFSAEEAEKLTHATVDLAAGLGLAGFEIAGIIQPLGQMQQVGRANLQDLKQLASRGVPVFDVLGKEFGKTTEEIRDMIEKGLIPADRAINAIVTSFAKDFKGAASASTRSLAGLLSTAQDLRATSLREFFTPIFEAVLFAKNEGDFALADLLSLENIQDTIKNARELGKTIAVDVNLAFQKAVVFIQAFLGIMRSIPAPVFSVVTGIAKFAAILLGISLSLGAFNAALIGLTSVLFLFVNPVSLAVAALVALGLAVTKNSDVISRAISDVTLSFGQLPQFLTTATNELTKFFQTGEISTTAFDGFSTTLKTIGTALISTTNIATKFGEGLLQAITTFIETGQASTDGFKELPGVLSFFATELFNTINFISSFVSAVLNMPTTIANAASTMSATFQSMLGEFVTWGANIITAFADGISSTVSLIGQALTAVGNILTFWLAPGSPPKIAPNLDEWGASAALEFVNNFVSTFISTLGEGFSAIGAAALTFVTGTFANAFGSIVIVLTGVFTAVSSLMVGIGNQIFLAVSTIVDIISTLTDSTLTGKEKIQGVLNSIGFFIRDTFVNVGRTIQGVATGIIVTLGGIATFIAGEFVVAFLALGNIAPIFTTTANAIINFATTADNSIREFGSGISDFIGDIFVNVTDYGFGLVESFADGIMAAVNVVADALSAIGEMVTYWLAPGSPPRLLPDIDQWGTDAASEFLQGFTKADFDTIGDFGDTVEKLLTSVGATDVDTEKIVEQFASGLASDKATGDFGAANFSQISQLAGEAGPEVLALAEKYAQLAKDQAQLNSVTEQYNKELEAVQGTLDTINRTEGIEANQAKVESLTNALSNSLLTQTERTRIQKQIEKLQAETRIKQLEAEKNAQEKNVSSSEEALNLQKEQLQLADKFDKTSPAVASQNSFSEATDKATKSQDKLTQAQLKYQLSTLDTAGKIQLLRGELAKMDEGSVEYFNTLTQIQKLEDQLAKERETESKRGLSAQEKINKADLDYRLSLVDTAGKIAILQEELGKVQVGSAEYYEILKKINTLQAKLGGEEKASPVGTLFEGIEEGGAKAEASIGTTVKNVSDRVTEMQTNVTNQFNTIRTNINTAVDNVKKFLDEWILKNDVVKASIAAIGVIFVGAKIFGGITALGATLALLSNPITAIAAGVIGLTAAFAFFAVSSGGIQGAVQKITESFTSLQNAFTLGSTTGEGTELDFSSFDTAIVSIGTNIGAAATNLSGSVTTFFTNLGTLFTNGLTTFTGTIGTIFTAGWQIIQTIIGGIFTNFVTANTILGGAVGTITSSLNENIIQPIINAFTNNETILGQISAALVALYTGIVTLLTDTFAQVFSLDISGSIENFFVTNPIASIFEKNINEAVGNIIPVLEGKFDLSETIGGIIDGIKTAFQGLITVKDTLSEAFGAIGDAFNTFSGIFTGEESGLLANIIEQNRAAFAEFISEVTSPEFISGLTNIGLLLAGLAGAVASVTAVIIDVAIIGLLKNFGDIIIEVGAGIGTLFDAFNLFLEGDILGGFGLAFQGVQEILEGVFGNVADIIADAVKALLEFFGIDTSGTIGTVIQIVLDLIVSFFSFRGIISIVTSVWSRLLGVFEVAKGIIPIIAALFAKKASSGTILSKVLSGLFSVLSFVANKLLSFPALLATAIHFFLQFPEKVQSAWSTLKENVSSAFSTIGTDIKNKISSIPTAIAEFVLTSPLGQQGLDLAANLISNFITGVGTNLTGFGSNLTTPLALIDLSGVASTIADTFSFNAPEIIEKLKTNITTTIDSAIAGITAIAFNVADALVVSEEEEQKLATKIQGLLPNFDTLFGEGSTEKTALALSDFVTINEEEFTQAKELFQSVIDTLSGFGTLLAIPEAFTASLTAIRDLIAGESTFSETLTTIATSLGTVVTNLNTAVGNPFALISDTIKGLSVPITTVAEGFGTLYQAIVSLLEIDLSGFTQVFAPITETFASIQEKIDGLKSGIGVLNLIPGVDIGGADVTGDDAVKQKIQDTLDNQTLSVNQKLEVLTDDANLATESKKLLDAFVTSYKENTTLGVVDFAAVNTDLISQGFTATDITTLASTFGKEVPAGLAEGLQDTTGELDRATRGLATNLLSEIASELGIQSPSTKARDDIGLPFIQGIVEGLSDPSSIIASVAAIADKMISTAVAILNESAERVSVAASLFTLNETTLEITNEALTEILNLHVETFTTLEEETIPQFITFFEESMTESFETILELSEEFSSEFISTLKKMASDSLNVLRTLRDSLGELSSDFKNIGKDLGESLMTGLKEAIEDNTASIVGAVNAIFGVDGTESTSLLKRAADSGKKLGRAFTEGVAEGIIAPTALAAIVDAVQEMIKEAQQAAEQAAGIESPSTLFRDAVGKNLVLGIAEGMLLGTQDLIDITSGILDTVFVTAQDNIGTQFTAGIASGIASGQLALNNTIIDVLSSSVIAAKNELQIKSPSKVTRNLIGLPYVDGIAVALESGKGRLSNAASSLLEILPNDKTFNYNINGTVGKQPIEMQYSNLLTSLPSLSQSVSLIRNGGMNIPLTLNYAANRMAATYNQMRQASAQQISYMNDSSRQMVSNHSVYNYEMHVVTTPDRVERVSHNFDAMRLRKRI